MHRLLRTYLAIALVALLALTGQSMAVARAASGPVGQVVLCTGTGPVTVAVDENGVPTGTVQYCPDCALTLLVAIAAPDPTVLPVVSRPVILPVVATIVHTTRLRGRATARAPPQFV